VRADENEDAKAKKAAEKKAAAEKKLIEKYDANKNGKIDPEEQLVIDADKAKAKAEKDAKKAKHEAKKKAPRSKPGFVFLAFAIEAPAAPGFFMAVSNL